MVCMPIMAMICWKQPKLWCELVTFQKIVILKCWDQADNQRRPFVRFSTTCMIFLWLGLVPTLANLVPGACLEAWELLVNVALDWDAFQNQIIFLVVHRFVKFKLQKINAFFKKIINLMINLFITTSSNKEKLTALDVVQWNTMETKVNFIVVASRQVQSKGPLAVIYVSNYTTCNGHRLLGTAGMVLKCWIL